MSSLTIPGRAKLLLRNASRQAMEDYFSGLRPEVKSRQWLTKTNRYRQNCTDIAEADAKAADKIPSDFFTKSQDRHLRAYVGASAPTHLIDGWSFLGRATEATMRGDTYSAAHFAYYAELRAAMSLLASEGFGVFDTRHVVIEATQSRYFPRTIKWTQFSTHQFIWVLLRYWSTLHRAGDLIDELIQPNQIHLSTWLASLNCPVRVNAIGQTWLSSWGIDLAATRGDRNTRNLASYRPSEFRLPQASVAADIAKFVADLWRMFEPGEDRRFQTVERHLLRQAWISGGSPTINQAEVERLGLPEKEAEHWIKFLGATQTSLPFQLAGATKPVEDPTSHLRIISRAALLLFLASGSTRQLLRTAGFTREDLSFWWSRHGTDRGLWSHDTRPDDPLDTWEDINAVLTDLENWRGTNPNSTLFDLRGSCSGSIDILSAFEHICIWSLLP